MKSLKPPTILPPENNSHSPFQDREPAYTTSISTMQLDPEWDQFLETSGAHHVQTSLWGQVKSAMGWRPIRIIVRENERIVGGVQILLRSLPFIGTIAYVPKGPVISAAAFSVDDLIHAMNDVAKSHAVKYLAVQPPNNGYRVARRLSEFGYLPSQHSIGVCATTSVDLHADMDALLSRMKPKTRYNIRLGQRRGIRCREGTSRDLSTLYRLLQATAKRQGFRPYPFEYFLSMERVLGPKGHFKLFLAEHRGEVASALLAVPFGDTVIFKKGAWSGELGSFRPNEAIHWAAIQWAASQGYRQYDLEGIDPTAASLLLQEKPLPSSLQQSVTRFKMGFGGHVKVYPRTYDRVLNPLLRAGYNSVVRKLTQCSSVNRAISFLRKL